MKLYKGDCLIKSDKIEDGSVDLILTDLPYGTMKGRDYSTQPNQKEGSKTAQDHEWDEKLDTSKIMQITNRILRKNGKMVLFAQDPFSTELKNKAIPNLPYNYSCVWEKSNFANCLLINKACVKFHEDILVFSKNNQKHDVKGLHPLRSYFKDVHAFIDVPKRVLIQEIGQSIDHVFRYNSTQFSLCTEKTYSELIEHFNIDKMQGFRPYNELKEVNDKFKADLNFELNERYPSTFNLWEGNKYKSSILKYNRSEVGYHPTQKPILLLEDLIKTFSNEGDLVVDLTMGSGSTGVACVNTNRQFIGIEKDNKYFDIATDRIKQAQIEKDSKLF